MNFQASRAVLTRGSAAERGADGAARRPYQEQCVDAPGYLSARRRSGAPTI